MLWPDQGLGDALQSSAASLCWLFLPQGMWPVAKTLLCSPCLTSMAQEEEKQGRRSVRQYPCRHPCTFGWGTLGQKIECLHIFTERDPFQGSHFSLAFVDSRTWQRSPHITGDVNNCIEIMLCSLGSKICFPKLIFPQAYKNLSTWTLSAFVFVTFFIYVKFLNIYFLYMLCHKRNGCNSEKETPGLVILIWVNCSSGYCLSTGCKMLFSHLSMKHFPDHPLISLSSFLRIRL